MTIDTLIPKLDLLINEIRSSMPAIADEVGLNAIALIKNRIVDQREGIPGASYSTKKMLATKDQFVVKSAFKQSTVEETRFYRRKNENQNTIGRKTTRKGDDKKVVKKKLWIKFKGADKAVPVMILDDGYKEFREIQGRPGDHVNASYTGKMWQGTTIVARLNKLNTWITVIGGNNEEAQMKLSAVTEKFGSFLNVNEEETKLLKQIFDNRITAIYNNIMTNE